MQRTLKLQAYVHYGDGYELRESVSLCLFDRFEFFLKIFLIKHGGVCFIKIKLGFCNI